MTDPIYPDKDKTGLAALKPLTDAFFAEPERWVWERNDNPGLSIEEWRSYSVDEVIAKVKSCWWQPDYIRLTPKPRRVWIGGQSYPEPLLAGDVEVGDIVYLANVLSQNIAEHVMRSAEGSPTKAWLRNGFLFRDEGHAQQCLDAYRKARRVE